MSSERPPAVIAAPSVLGLRPSGVERLAERLLELGLAEAIGARIAARLDPPPWRAGREPGTGTLNAQAIADWTPRLADAVGAVLAADQFPVVLGGDCSILLGSMLALRRRGRFGLLFLDGHADFYQPDANPNGEAASMELAFATGSGPDLLTHFDGISPLVCPEEVAVLGYRDGAEQAAYGSQPLPGEMLALDLDAVRAEGAEAAARRAVARLTGDRLEGFFIHLDADVLADAVMPAVDYRTPDGLTSGELETILRVALGSGHAVGMEITIYNPALDPDGTAGRELVRIVRAAFGATRTV